LKSSLVVAVGEEAEVAVGVAAEVLAAVAVVCVPAAGSRPGAACRAVRAWALGQAEASRGQVPAGGRGRVEDK